MENPISNIKTKQECTFLRKKDNFMIYFMNESKNSSWKPVTGQIMTRWVSEINPEDPLPDYPRPQLKRKEWLNLNGLWDYAIRPKEQTDIESFDGKILVPFPIESALSGVKRKLQPEQHLWYRRKFKIPESWKGKKILLHFGAVDWETTVWINKKLVGTHKGGYIPFHFEISEFLNGSQENDIKLSVWDPTDKGYQGQGKQSLNPKIIFYTAVSGIWQTVWLEPVADTYIKNLKMVPNIDKESLELTIEVGNLKPNDRIHIIIPEKENQTKIEQETTDCDIPINIPSPKLWSPHSPFLYDIIIEIKRNDAILDKVESYFGMRKISLGTSNNGIKQIELNNTPLFQYGTLDQGYWPDGLYTAPTDDALRYDVEVTKELGFNMIRKHVKVEPARWYYHCDKLGILVWQDMPSGEQWTLFKELKWKLTSDKRFKGKRKQPDKIKFYNELESMINFLYNSPAVVVWVPFNEGWGQFDTKKVVEKIRILDSSRLIDSASGYFDKGVGDIIDVHSYPNPKMPKNLKGRAAVVGEFGGLGLEIKEHMWKFKRKFVYRNFPDQYKLLKKYENLILQLKILIKKDLSAAIYTQITDIEQEINGLLTYDREVIKMDIKNICELNRTLYKT
ncbi:MAG: glycoside hydrolase family 2 protein [Promethearchaeota archaeon]